MQSTPAERRRDGAAQSEVGVDDDQVRRPRRLGD
jgi:hypothetical protein